MVGLRPGLWGKTVGELSFLQIKAICLAFKCFEKSCSL